ncbi:Phospholipase/carboxylesterase/thioesterase [Trinorchestia longiramus]|nr:Phospholipase/carboxylesterase/thioesterase [Trinorchestia longiramus]
MSRISKVFTVQPTASRCAGSIIFLHGSGDTGSSFYSWWCNELGRELKFENVRLHFPTAAPMFYTPVQSLFNVWMNRIAIDISSPEDEQSTNDAVKSISELIDKEVQTGIPLNKIIIGLTLNNKQELAAKTSIIVRDLSVSRRINDEVVGSCLY